MLSSIETPVTEFTDLPTDLLTKIVTTHQDILNMMCVSKTMRAFYQTLYKHSINEMRAVFRLYLIVEASEKKQYIYATLRISIAALICGALFGSLAGLLAGAIATYLGGAFIFWFALIGITASIVFIGAILNTGINHLTMESKENLTFFKYQSKLTHQLAHFPIEALSKIRKRELINAITEINDKNLSCLLLKACLDPNTTLGQRFLIKEDYDGGILEKIREYLNIEERRPLFLPWG